MPSAAHKRRGLVEAFLHMVVVELRTGLETVG